MARVTCCWPLRMMFALPLMMRRSLPWPLPSLTALLLSAPVAAALQVLTVAHAGPPTAPGKLGNHLPYQAATAIDDITAAPLELIGVGPWPGLLRVNNAAPTAASKR
jgi:hypothetical protein